MREAAILGLGVTLLVLPDVLANIQRGELARLLPDWHADADRFRCITRAGR